MLAAQAPATAWQNFQASPMYPGSSPAVQGQVPGGQVPSWDPTMQAVSPSYAPVAPGTFPGQTYVTPAVPAYSTAMPAASSPPVPAYSTAMLAASSPLAQTSFVSQNANSHGVSHSGIQQNVNIQPTSASPPAPGSSPVMQGSLVAQGNQPNIRPGGASPPGQQPYYG